MLILFTSYVLQLQAGTYVALESVRVVNLTVPDQELGNP